jgi:predicted RNA-binding Zn ribbon-like protein
VQPGGRAPAPGELALVQAFVNTHYDLEGEHGADLFCSPAALALWLAARELIGAAARVGPRELRSALAVREGLRALAASNTRRARAREALDRLNGAARGALVELRFTATGPRFVAPEAAGVNGALGVVLAITARAMVDGSWSRLKVCPGEDCGWAFYDHSRNQTGRWCSMSVCGGRAKARAHYRRRRSGSR